MMDPAAAARFHAARQLAHWAHAVEQLRDLDNFASPQAWAGLERYLGLALRRGLSEGVARLESELTALAARLRAAQSSVDLDLVHDQLSSFRARFLRVETALDFYGDAVNTRSAPRASVLLRACDILATRSMEALLRPLGIVVPPVLCHLDKGLGAALLRHNLRLWDGATLSPCAAIKLTRHNLLRPTSLVHEAGHQVAHLTGWNDHFRSGLLQLLAREPVLGRVWAGWASEITADAFAFAHTGYAAVVALHDVVAGDPTSVFEQLPGDPHPIPWLRVQLNIEMAIRFFGAGPWEALGQAWTMRYPLHAAASPTRQLLERSLEWLPRIAELTLSKPVPGFANRPLAGWIDPTRVRPDRLAELERTVGVALYRSPHWIETECLRLLALSGWKDAMRPELARENARETESWLSRLGAVHAVAA